MSVATHTWRVTRGLTVERTAVIILFALLFALATRIPVDTDTWWHLRSGEHILTEGFIYQDPFSFTKAGADWVNHSWGGQLILFGVWELAGDAGLALYTAALATAGMAVIYRMCAGSVYLRMFALVLGAATAAIFWSPRPQMLSFFLSTAILYILLQYKREDNDRLWLIPVLMMLWANLHAGFSIGFIFMGGTIAGETLNNVLNPGGEEVIDWRGVRKLVIVGLAAAAALAVSPYGPRMWTVPFQTVSIGVLRDFIEEWNSPDFHQRGTWPFAFLIFALLLAVGKSPKRLDWTDFVLVSGTAFMGLLAGRNIAVFAVAATPALTVYGEAALAERGWTVKPARRVTPGMARLNVALVLVVLAGSLAKVALVLDAETVSAAQERFLPVRAAEYLNDAEPDGPMFNSYNWGGYLMFAAPDYPVFVDGRTDLYGDDLLTTYLRAATARGDWRATLNEFGINLVIVEADSGLARALREEAGWRLDYEDAMAVIFVREGDDDGAD